MSDPNQPLFAAQAPAGLPEYERRAPTHPLNPVLPIVAVTASVLYVVLCVVEIFALAHHASMATSLADGTSSVTLDQADSADRLVNGLSIAALLAYLAAFIVYLVWTRSVRSQLAPTGRGAELIKQSGYAVYRGIWLVALLLSLFLNKSVGTGDDSFQQIASHDHQTMLYFGLRALIGVALAVFVLRFRTVSMRIYRESLTPSVPSPFVQG